MWSDSNVIAYHLLKVHRLSNGALVGGGGGPGFCQWFLRWCERGCPALEQAFPDPGEASFAGLHISRCGDVTHYGANMLPVSVEAPYHAIGAPSSVTFALGALAAGANAVQAVRLAIQNTDGASGEVSTVILPGDGVIAVKDRSAWAHLAAADLDA